MLAKELKIKTLKKQREFIEEQLSHADIRKDGDTSYTFVGHIYPEVIKYFEEEGFVVTRVPHSDMLTAATKGRPVYIFTVADSIALTPEELEEAEAYKPQVSELFSDEDMPDFLKALFSGHT